MKKIFLYCLTAILGLGFASCTDDDENMNGVNPVEDFDRMPMTQFRHEETTNKDESADRDYCSMVIEEELNTIRLSWYGIEGAAGYEIKYGPHADLQNDQMEIQEANWNDPTKLTGHFYTDANTHMVYLRHLDYGVTYRFAIRVLHPDFVEKDAQGNITNVIESEKHSHWYGIAQQREWARFLRLETKNRYDTPAAINVGNISEDRDAFTVYVDVNFKSSMADFRSKYSSDQEMLTEAQRRFDFVQDGNQNDPAKAKFFFDYLTVTPSKSTPQGTVDEQFKMYPIDVASFKNGKAEIRVTGLSQNCIYDVNLINSQRPVPLVDQRANSIAKPIYGEPGEPILIEHKVRATDSIPGEVEYNACYLDKIFTDFNNNVNLAEGQTFYLEGDKAYYFFANPEICKGFILETRPEDVAEGKRAKVYLGGIGVGLNENGGLTSNIQSCNFMFGRRRSSGEADAPIEVGSVIFRNIDFDCPLAPNFGQGSPQGNYFANMYSDGMAVTFKSLEIYNCTFQRMIRGFIRVQGSKQKKFEKIVIDGNLFYNCGYYDGNGRGYAWIAGDGKLTNANIYNDFSFTNNTIYDSPRTAFITDSDKNLSYDSNVHWNIRLDGNTFINYSTRTTGRNFFQTRYVPGGSYYSFQRNLIVLVNGGANDQRALNQYGADIREIKGDGTFSFDVKDNYAVGCTDAHLAEDGIFTKSQSFTRTSNSFGATKWNPGNKGSKEDLITHVLRDDNGNPMKATDLFTAPNCPYSQASATDDNPKAHAAPDDIFSALKYKVVPSVITEKNIGDPRWR